MGVVHNNCTEMCSGTSNQLAISSHITKREMIPTGRLGWIRDDLVFQHRLSTYANLSWRGYRPCSNTSSWGGLIWKKRKPWSDFSFSRRSHELHSGWDWHSLKKWIWIVEVVYLHKYVFLMCRNRKNSFHMKMGKLSQAIAIRLHKVIRLGGKGTLHAIKSKESKFLYFKICD